MTLLLRKAWTLPDDIASRVGIVDIGSNSIRLVIYQGPRRLPSILFNEKVLAGLGKGMSESGEIAEASLELARGALARFGWLAREMGVAELRVVATAAVRDAPNGHLLIEAARKNGLDVEILSGEEEAIAAGYGVISAIPEADGIVGDLGGGSLELVRVKDGQVGDRVSFPLGVLRIGEIREKGKGALDRRVRDLLKQSGWLGKGEGLPLYLVGGSWRALARLDMHLTHYPLPVIHSYPIPIEEIGRLARAVGQLGKSKLKAVPNLSSGRIPTLKDAAMLLSVLMRHLGSQDTIASAFGLREGLLYGALAPEEAALDPLIVAARSEGARLGRFPEHGDLLDRWIAPLFADEPADKHRLRHAACLLADVGWLANPEFRAERGMEIALHGNWVAIDGYGRALLAQALFTCLGGGLDSPSDLVRLADFEALDRAKRWGLAMRLGQRMSGGVEEPLRRSRLSMDDQAIRLSVNPGDEILYGDSVERRLKTLANAFNRSADFGVDQPQ